MRTAFRIFRRDIRRVVFNRAAAIVMIGVCLLPSLYAWFNIAANMDPYGNTKGIRVAVVSNDTGSVKGSIDINAGESITDSLKKNDQLGWTFTGEDEAIEGVKAGDYYAAIVIPEDFSRSLLSILSGKVGKPELDYYINEKKNAIAPKITDTGATTIQNEINDTFSSVASEAIAGLVSSAADKISGDINSADWELARDISEVRANLREYQDTLKNFSSTAAGADAAIKDTKAALDKVDDTATSSASALKDTSSLLKKSRTSLGEFSGQCSQSLSEADLLLNSITVSASSKLGNFETKVDQVTTVIGSDLDSLSDILKKNEKLLQELEAIHDQIGSDSQLAQQISQQIERLKAQNASLKELTGSLSSGNAAIKHATATAAETRKELEKITAQNRKTLLGYRSDIEKNLLPQASQSLDDLATLSGRLSATLDGIQPVTAQVRGVLDQLGSSLDTSASALGETGTILESVDGQLEDVINDIHAIKSSKVYRELLSLEGLNSRAIANFMASPVLIESRTLYNVDNYGSGMTPFYTNLAIWVGGLILVSILKQEVDREGLEHKISPTCAYFSRWLMFVAAALVQGFIVCLGDLLLLGVKCVSPVPFMLAGLICSFVYVNIIYALAITLKHIGKAVAVLLIILQIPGSSGTYPIEMMPRFFQDLCPLMPFYYGIDAMRESLAGIYGTFYIKDIMTLFVFAGLALLLGVVIRPLLMNLNHMFDKRLADTEMMICETATAQSDDSRLKMMMKVVMRDEHAKAQILKRSIGFEKHYPRLIRQGFILIIAIPLVFLVLMLFTKARLVFLVLWILSLILLSAYLICIEYAHDRIEEQLDIEGMSPEDIVHTIEEEREK